MIRECSYSDRRDLCDVVPGLSVDLLDALESGVIPDSGKDVDYNGLDDPSLIGQRVEDEFDAVIKKRSLLSKSKTSNKQPTPTGEDA